MTFARQSQEWADIRHLQVLAWMVVGLISEGSINLTCWLAVIDTKAQYAQSTQRRLRRWLGNSRINVARIYSSLIANVLRNWQDREIFLSLDTTTLWEQYCLIRISTVYRGRAVTVGWRVLSHGSSSVRFEEYQGLLKRVAGIMPEGVKVVLLADRGFIDSRLCSYVSETLRWHYRIRLKKNTWIYRKGKGWKRLKNFPFQPGQALLFHHVKVYKTEEFTLEGVHLALAYEPIAREYWYILSSEPTTVQTFQEYGYRFDIEEEFLDNKSNGFQLEDSQLRDTKAISRLCMVIAVASLYLTLQGTAVLEAGKRRMVDPHWFRGQSYFKLGWQWLKMALARGLRFFKLFQLTSAVDPEPAKASQKQHEQRSTRLEFQAYIFDYSP